MTIGRGGMAVAALALAAFCFGTTETLPIGLLPLIADGLDVSASAVGLLVTGYGAVVAVVSVPLVRMTVGMGRRRLLTGVMLVFVVMTFAAAAAPGYGALFAARLVTALAQAVFWPVAVVAAAACCRRSRGAGPPPTCSRAGRSPSSSASPPAPGSAGRPAGARPSWSSASSA
ncbi:MFS transporter [Actinomadura madurae]|uniref:MFS transporter n=1 Tax=Actinomadura madurae TaxID=1993 RepID=UPI0020D24033|nr:MFS transporter [Actinomadura madurae]MCQ0010056.1 MFS transporter [Actinomadura madurae]